MPWRTKLVDHGTPSASCTARSAELKLRECGAITDKWMNCQANAKGRTEAPEPVG
jgi:hypothetical protein